MKKSMIGCMVGVFLFLGGFFASPLVASYGGGGGWTGDDPFLISEPAHLLAIGSHPEHWDKFFKLTADIDLSDFPWTASNFIGINWGTGAFSGTFDGAGHTISNLTYTAAGGNYVGLFGGISSGTVRNLNLDHVTLNLDASHYVGGLVGIIMNSGRIENCHVRYAITVGDSRQFIGGLAGQAVASILTDCSSDGTLTVGKGSMQAGGLVGWSSANIVNCHTTGAIVTVGVGTSSQKIGGLVGEHEGQYGPIDGCWSACTITPGGSAYAIGGLVGRHTLGNITNCFTTGAVQGTYNIGGLVGTSVIAEDAYGTLSNCHSTSDVTGNRLLGGLAGYCEYTIIEDCRSSGTVRGADSAQQVGGLVGQFLYFGSRISNCSSTSTVLAGTNAWQIGGLCGTSSNGLIENSYSAGSVVTGGGDTRFVGGLAGTSGGSGGAVRNCYSLCSIDAGTTGRWVGGLVGQTHSQEIKHCFAAGAIQSGGDYTGGLIGENFDASSTVTGCVWDKEASGIDHSDGGKGYLTAVMQQQSTFTSMAWDFTNTWKMYDYPGLVWQPEIGINGDLSISLGAGETAVLPIEVCCLRNTTIRWDIQGQDVCGWITAVAPSEGSSTGPGDVTTIQITIDSSGLGLGTYVHELSLVGDNGETLSLPVTLEVFSRIKLDTFAALSQYWGTGGCDFGQPCKTVDWYVDGAIDWRDLNLLAEAWLGQSIGTVKATLEEGFESGDFSGLDWQTGGDAPWTITSDSYEGGWAARSGSIADTQTSVLEVTLDLTGWQANTIWFAWKTSSESGFDILRFYIDDVEQLSASGLDSQYRTFAYPGGIGFTPGVRTFKWVYSKDAGDAAGQDCAWIDDIRIYAQ